MFEQNSATLITHQYASSCRLTGDEFAGPVLGLRHPPDLCLFRAATATTAAGAALRLGLRLAVGRRHFRHPLLAEHPRQDAPREDEQQPREEGDETGAEERVPVPVLEALRLRYFPVVVSHWSPRPRALCRGRTNQRFDTQTRGRSPTARGKQASPTPSSSSPAVVDRVGRRRTGCGVRVTVRHHSGACFRSRLQRRRFGRCFNFGGDLTLLVVPRSGVPNDRSRVAREVHPHPVGCSLSAATTIVHRSTERRWNASTAFAFLSIYAVCRCRWRHRSRSDADDRVAAAAKHELTGGGARFCCCWTDARPHTARPRHQPPCTAAARDNYHLNSHEYVCITTYQPDIKSNPQSINQPVTIFWRSVARGSPFA